MPRKLIGQLLLHALVLLLQLLDLFYEGRNGFVNFASAQTQIEDVRLVAATYHSHAELNTVLCDQISNSLLFLQHTGMLKSFSHYLVSAKEANGFFDS